MKGSLELYEELCMTVFQEDVPQEQLCLIFQCHTKKTSSFVLNMLYFGCIYYSHAHQEDNVSISPLI